MTISQTTARLHHHAGRIAVAFGDGGVETIYLTPRLAKNLSKELATASTQIINSFHYETTHVGEK